MSLYFLRHACKNCMCHTIVWEASYNNYFSASVRCFLCCFTYSCLILCPLQSGINTAGQGGGTLLTVSVSATPWVLPWLIPWKGWSSAWIPHAFLVTLQLSMLCLGCSIKHSSTKAFQNPNVMQVHSHLRDMLLRKLFTPLFWVLAISAFLCRVQVAFYCVFFFFFPCLLGSGFVKQLNMWQSFSPQNTCSGLISCKC